MKKLLITLVVATVVSMPISPISANASTWNRPCTSSGHVMVKVPTQSMNIETFFCHKKLWKPSTVFSWDSDWKTLNHTGAKCKLTLTTKNSHTYTCSINYKSKGHAYRVGYENSPSNKCFKKSNGKLLNLDWLYCKNGQWVPITLGFAWSPNLREFCSKPIVGKIHYEDVWTYEGTQKQLRTQFTECREHIFTWDTVNGKRKDYYMYWATDYLY